MGNKQNVPDDDQLSDEQTKVHVTKLECGLSLKEKQKNVPDEDQISDEQTKVFA